MNCEVGLVEGVTSQFAIYCSRFIISLIANNLLF